MRPASAGRSMARSPRQELASTVVLNEDRLGRTLRRSAHRTVGRSMLRQRPSVACGEDLIETLVAIPRQFLSVRDRVEENPLMGTGRTNHVPAVVLMHLSEYMHLRNTRSSRQHRGGQVSVLTANSF